MIDKRTLWEQTDCRDLIERDLGKPKLRNDKYRQWACPLHGEQHGSSFTVYQNGWTCFGKCQKSGDVLAWLETYHRLSREEAWVFLGLPEKELSQRFVTPAPLAPQRLTYSIVAPPSVEWQSAALAIVELAEKTLWGWQKKRALDYLRQQRGLGDHVIREARIGYVPGRFDDWDHAHGLNIPCGITLPAFADGHLWGIKVRRAAGYPKYIQVTTNKHQVDRMGLPNLHGALYWSDQILPGWPALVCEGEFDCLVTWQEARDLVCPVTVGGAANNLNPYWYAALAGCNPILACTDNDEAGDKAAARLLDFGARVRRIIPPHGKDISEFYQTAPMKDVYNWLATELDRSTEKASAA